MDPSFFMEPLIEVKEIDVRDMQPVLQQDAKSYFVCDMIHCLDE